MAKAPTHPELKPRNKLMAAIHEAASDLYSVGGIDKKTMREFDEGCLQPIKPLTPRQIMKIRTREKASQAVFAFYLNVSTGVVSKWERGDKRPSGASLKLLDLVNRKGLDVML